MNDNENRNPETENEGPVGDTAPSVTIGDNPSLDTPDPPSSTVSPDQPQTSVVPAELVGAGRDLGKVPATAPAMGEDSTLETQSRDAEPVPLTTAMDGPGTDSLDGAIVSEPEEPLRDPGEIRSGAGQAMREGRFTEAADALTALVRTHRDDAEAWRLLGGALSSLGDTEAAVVAFTEALRCRPAEARSHYNLALALERAGRVDAAKDRYGACLAIDPTHAGALERRSLLGTNVASEAVFSPATGPSETEPHSLDTAASPPGQSPRRLQPPVPTFRNDSPQGGSQTQRSSRWGETPESSPMDRVPGGRQRPLQPRPTSAAEAELQSSTIFALGIVGVAGGLTCGLPLLVSPVAWMMANQSIERMKKMDDVDPTVRNQLQAGRAMGIVGTTLLGLFVLLVLVLVLIGIAA